jgi:hypothetical protein
MKNLHLPSGIAHGLDFLIPGDWSPDQALAVVELLDDLRECIIARYQIALNEVLREQRAPPGNPHPRDNETDPF